MNVRATELPVEVRSQLDRIERRQDQMDKKLDALIQALADDRDVDDDEYESMTLDGDRIGEERDKDEPL